MSPFDSFLVKVENALLNPLITLLSLGAFIVFVWGAVEFVSGAGNEEKREKGKRHLLWGFVGLMILFGAKAIVSLLAASVGTDISSVAK